MKYSKTTTVIFFFATGIICALLLELAWFYCIPMPLWLSKEITINYCMNIPRTQLIRSEKEYPHD